MSRNVNSRFALNPTNIDLSRSKFSRDSSYKTSFNVGEVIPFYLDEVLPGDTFQIKTNKVVRFQPMVTAPMDNVYFDTYYFYVPNRLTWQHWKEFNGENTESAWIPETEYAIPQITAPADGWNVGSLADYFGLPTGVDGISVSALPFRAYALIIDEWFRDQNLQQPLNIPKDDSTVTGVNTGDYVTDIVLGGKPFIAAKYHDYFTSCLPSPQKGPDVTLNLGGTMPVYATSDRHSILDNSTDITFKSLFDNTIPTSGSDYEYFIGAFQNKGTSVSSGSDLNGYTGIDTTLNISSNPYPLSPDNLWASASDSVGVTVNQLRMAFQIQKLYEKDARGGKKS